MVSRIWDKDLNKDERKMLLRATYPNRSNLIIDLEAGKSWTDLLPSTQSDLRDVDWCAVLDRDVRPD